MNIPKFLIFACFLVVMGIHSAESQNSTVTFQNGTDGYQGCEDTYIDRMIGDNNFSTLDKMNCENYSVQIGSG